jgi:predicted deacylase
MRAETYGGEQPEYGIVGSLHGDEPCGQEVIDRIATDFPDLQKSLKCVVAHTAALDEGAKYFEKDLNRAFPGNPNSAIREERLAARILQEVQGLNILDLHSTMSQPTPFAIASLTNSDVKQLVASTGVSSVVDISGFGPRGSLIEQVGGVSVECGPQGDSEAVENGVEIVQNFLAVNNLLSETGSVANPEVYRIYDIKGAPTDAQIELMCENFQRVSEGSVYARIGAELETADESFYPVLMSERGYRERGVLGFKARQVGSLFDENEFRGVNLSTPRCVRTGN